MDSSWLWVSYYYIIEALAAFGIGLDVGLLAMHLTSMIYS